MPPATERPETTPYPIRLSQDQRGRIKDTSIAVDLSFAESVRKAIDFGLPVLKERLARKPGR